MAISRNAGIPNIRIQAKRKGSHARCSFDIVQHFSQSQFQCPCDIRILRIRSTGCMIRQIHRPCPGLRGQTRRGGTVLGMARIGDIVDYAGRMPRWRVEHHASGRFTSLSTLLSSSVRIRLALGSVPFSGRGARLATGNTASKTPDLLDIVYSIRLLLEQKLVQMST